MGKKILLFGDYSAVNLNLKRALIQLGHEATLFSTGDTWKQYETDISYNDIFSSKKGYINVWNYYKFLKALPQFDIIQIHNNTILGAGYSYKYPINASTLFFNILRQKSEKIFLQALGKDSTFWIAYKRGMYGNNYSSQKYASLDASSKGNFWLHPRIIKFEQYVHSMVNGIIPMSIDYKLCFDYLDIPTQPIINFPINTDEIKYFDNVVQSSKKIVFLHGIQQPAFNYKGSRFIIEALQNMQAKYPSDIEFVLPENLPYNSYKELLAKANVIIDQTNSYSPGMNALISMAMGKVVLTGAEDVYKKSVGEENIPHYNINPDVKQIEAVIKSVLDCRDKITDIGLASRSFVEKNHNYLTIAQRFIDCWDAC